MVTMKTFRSRKLWEAARTRIGGSDASAIVGCNPYMDNQELWEIKTGQKRPADISGKDFVKYGVQAEMSLRNLFKLDFPELTVGYRPNNMWLNDKYPFAHASLDGWLTDENGRRGVLEIKTTNILQSQQKEKWHDQIPQDYFVQILHYLMVTEFDFAVLKAQLKSEVQGVPYIQTRHYWIERADVDADIEYLVQAETGFHAHLMNGTCPNLVLPNI